MNKHKTERKCSFPGCEKKHTAKGLCRGHYQQRREGKELTEIIFQKDMVCSATDCDRPAEAKGKCQRHYSLERSNRLREESAHPCESPGCDGTAYLTSILCLSCSRKKIWERGREGRRKKKEEWLANRPLCSILECEEQISAKTPKTGTTASVLCVRHSEDFSKKSCTIEFYLELMSIDSCESCGSTDTKLIVDHAHIHEHGRDGMCETCIRGRLCHGCNTALGLLGEDAARISGLLEYLEKHAQA